jgi:DedD protein
MNESLPESDDQLTFKKRARRRLIGAIVFVTFAAVVLPMVMDEEAPPATPSIELNIPAQDKGFVAPPTGEVKPAEPAPVADAAPPASVDEAPAPAAPVARIAEAKPVLRPTARPAVKPEAKPTKPIAAKPSSDAKRAQALLEGQVAEPAADVPHVVLIGAFANPGNVQNLQKKLGELGLRVYTEPLDSPQGKKTRVRAGPFPNRAAAEKAVARMKAIGVGGVVAPKS